MKSEGLSDVKKFLGSFSDRVADGTFCVVLTIK